MSDALLLQAIRDNDCNEIAYLVEEDNANVNQDVKSGYSPIHLAVQSKNLALVKLLVTYKADVNKKGPSDLGGFTALHLCAQRDSWQIAEFLLDSKASVDAKSESKSTPLIEAAKYGSTNFVTVALGFKCDGKAVDCHGMSANYYATKAGNLNLAKRLPAVPYDEWANVKNDPSFEAIKAASAGKGGKKGKKKKKK